MPEARAIEPHQLARKHLGDKSRPSASGVPPHFQPWLNPCQRSEATHLCTGLTKSAVVVQGVMHSVIFTAVQGSASHAS